MTTQINYSTQQPSFNNKSLTLSDSIELLPTDKIPPSRDDIHIANTLFGENKSITEKVIYEGKDIFIIGILFICFSLPQVDEIIQRFIPITKNSNSYLIIFKSIMVMILYWLIKNFYLSRNT